MLRTTVRSGALRRASALIGACALTVAGVSCGDDAGDTASDLQDRAGEVANQTAARTQAEAVRALLVARAGNAAEHRSMTVLGDALADLPGEVTSSGLTDSDRDGLDDDGKVQIEVRGEFACVSVEGTDTTVESGRC